MYSLCWRCGIGASTETNHHSCFFFNDTATTEIYTLSLHDALPICPSPPSLSGKMRDFGGVHNWRPATDRKSTRLNSSHIPLSRMPSSALKKMHGNTISVARGAARVEHEPVALVDRP